MTDNFTGQVFAWLNQVLADHSLPAAAFKLAYCITQHINRKSRTAWPSQARLAKAIGLDVRTVRRLAEQLATAGHLDVEVHQGGQRTNDYRLTFKSDTSARTIGEEDESNADTGVRSDEIPTGHLTSSNRTPVSDDLSENHSALRAEGLGGVVSPVAPLAPRGAAAREGGFVEFQKLWRRGHADNPDKSRKAFGKAVAEHGADAILASARRWAAAREPRYLPNPVEFLAGGWQSEPPPERAAGGGNGNRRGKVDPVEAMLQVAGWLDGDGGDA